MAFGKNNKSRDFLDDVVDDMGDEDGKTKYGADMSEGSDEEEADETNDEEATEDRAMAAGQVAKALGISTADKDKLAKALEAFVKTCM